MAERARHAEELDRLTAIIKELQRHRFGRRSEQLDPDQLALALEDLEQTIAATEAAAEKDGEVPAKPAAARKRQINRGALPVHLPREEIVIDVEDKTCACCGGLKHRIGEDVSERLDVIPAQLKVIVTRRPKYACRACAGEVTQAPAPERLIESGIPTEALIAHVLVAKYADHTPLYRQAQIYARQGITLDRSTLADWVGRAAFALRPVHARLFELLKQSSKLFADETTAPVLDPGRGRTKKGQLWAYARDERPCAGACGNCAPSRSSTRCVPGLKPSSPPSQANRPSPRRSATRSRAGMASPGSWTTVASRSTPMSSNAPSARSRSAARTISLPVRMAAARTGQSLPRSKAPYAARGIRRFMPPPELCRA